MKNCCQEIYPDCDLRRWEYVPSSIIADAENYYTKSEIDTKLEDIVESGCCITSEEVDEKIESAITSLDLSDYAKKEDIPSLSGYATEQWVEDKHYISGVDLSDYATKSEIPTVPTNVSAFVNDAGYLTQHQSLSGYATEQWVSAFTYDKQTIDQKVSQGGTFDPTQYYTTGQTDSLLSLKLDASAYTPTDLSNYYNKTETNNLLDDKLDASAYTPTDLTNYYNKTEVNNLISSAKTEIESEIPTVPTSNSAFTNDMGYLTEHQQLKTINNQSIVGTGNIDIQFNVWYGTKNEYDAILNKDATTLYLIYES